MKTTRQFDLVYETMKWVSLACLCLWFVAGMYCTYRFHTALWSYEPGTLWRPEAAKWTFSTFGCFVLWKISEIGVKASK